MKSVPFRKEEVFLKAIDNNETILYSPITRNVHLVNSTAALIWQACDGTRDLSQIAEIVEDEFETKDESLIRRDIEKFVSKLKGLDLIGIKNK